MPAVGAREIERVFREEYGRAVAVLARHFGDIDNAVISLVFADGRLGVVDLSRNGVYGYDITTEVLGTKGTVRVGYLRETPLVVMTRNHVAHDTVPYFMERFEKAYTAQLQPRPCPGPAGQTWTESAAFATGWAATR